MSVFLGIALLGLMLLLTGIHPASARGESSSADIRDIISYVADGKGFTQVSPTEIRLLQAGAWVKLQSLPTADVTIGVTDADGFKPIKLKAGEPLTITSSKNPSPTWGTKVWLYDVRPIYGTQTTESANEYQIGLLTSVLGPDLPGLFAYIKDNVGDPEVWQPFEGTLPGEAEFSTTIKKGTRNIADFPGLDGTARFVGVIKWSSTLKDSAGQPLFPSLQSKGIQKVLLRMALSAAQDTRSFNACRNLYLLLMGMDMTGHQAPVQP